MQVVKLPSVEILLFQSLCGSLKKNKVLDFMNNVKRNMIKNGH